MEKQAENENEVITKAYVDQLHYDNERNRRDLGLSFYNEEAELIKNNQDIALDDKKLLTVNIITNNQNRTSDKEVANKKYFDDSIGEYTIVRFIPTLPNYLEVSVGNDT